MSDRKATATELHDFAATVAHELRTPLVAVAGEVELALRRNRTAAEYREALRRIAAGISALVDITGDLTLLGEPVDPARPTTSSTASLAAVLTALQTRYAAQTDVRIAVDGVADARVAGDALRLGRAVVLVIEHALRYRRANASLSLRAHVSGDGHAVVAVGAQDPGFWPNAWTYLRAAGSDAAGPLRLRAARRIVEDSGGALRVAGIARAEVVQIELRVSA